MRSDRFGLAVMLGLVLAVSSAAGTQKAMDAEGHQWWQHAVFYEIYPRSFADSDNSGMGDLNGITSRLDYLKQLGVDAIWITPCFPSPQVDFGYDVSDYEDIDPVYGTLGDFDHMVSEGRKRNIRIILDFVINHTSDQHKWFLDSKSFKGAAHRDWYVWRDGNGSNPPNNWTSTFGGSAWKFDPVTNQYFYHYFYTEQPDLNWRNPAVEKAMFDVTRWWYKRGVAGFRLDAVDTLFERADLIDNPTLPGRNKLGDPNTDEIYNKRLPEVHGVLSRLRGVADESDAVLIGETWTSSIDELKEYYGGHTRELQMPMDFMFANINQLNPAEFRRQIAGVDGAGGWPVYLLSNHDMVRAYNRYGDGKHNDQIAKLMAGLYLTLRGTPIMYYGEELGMENNDPKRQEDVKDPIGKLGWPKEKGRDGERTPMQWNDSANAGFSTATPWLPVPPSAGTHNVATEDKDPDSILNFIATCWPCATPTPRCSMANTLPSTRAIPTSSPTRRYKDEAVLVVLNMSATAQTVRFDLAPQGLAAARASTLLTTMKPAPSGAGTVSIEPFGVYMTKLTK